MILERRDRIGGTWDLFRYPGMRSDSSVFTLCFPWEPWTRHGRCGRRRGHPRVPGQTPRARTGSTGTSGSAPPCAADWDSSTDTWTVEAEHDGATVRYRGRFVAFGSGYYNYEQGYTPEFPGLENFAGNRRPSPVLAG